MAAIYESYVCKSLAKNVFEVGVKYVTIPMRIKLEEKRIESKKLLRMAT